jgi:hypothetical protein
VTAALLRTTTASDETLHLAPEAEPFWTETVWLGLADPEQAVTGALYVVLRPNQQIASLGVYLWDDTARHHHDILYSQTFWHLPMPEDVRDMALPFGFSYRMTAPLEEYEVRYDDGGELVVGLTYRGLHPPVARGHGDAISGLTQLCHVSGSVDLNGERLDIDGYELRARAWDRRSDQRFPLRPPEPAPVPGYSDTYAASSEGGFLVGTAGTLARTEVHGGYLLRDGLLQPIVRGERQVLRRSEGGVVEELVVEAEDAAGRTLRAHGTCVNHFLMQATPGVLFWVNGTRWDVDGEEMWGEDQDVPGGREPRRFQGS